MEGIRISYYAFFGKIVQDHSSIQEMLPTPHPELVTVNVYSIMCQAVTYCLITILTSVSHLKYILKFCSYVFHILIF